jgi:hypothetical protein
VWFEDGPLLHVKPHFIHLIPNPYSALACKTLGFDFLGRTGVDRCGGRDKAHG